MAPPPSEELKLQGPTVWKRRLEELAAERAISVAALVRIYLREALYEGRKGAA